MILVRPKLRIFFIYLLVDDFNFVVINLCFDADNGFQCQLRMKLLGFRRLDLFQLEFYHLRGDLRYDDRQTHH